VNRMIQVFALLVAITVLAPAQAAEKHQLARKVVTVHIDGHLGSGLAKKTNEMHAKMEAEGWRFAAMAPHMENGDTEGLWITYVRD